MTLSHPLFDSGLGNETGLMIMSFYVWNWSWRCKNDVMVCLGLYQITVEWYKQKNDIKYKMSDYYNKIRNTSGWCRYIYDNIGYATHMSV